MWVAMIYFVEAADFELLGFKNADLAFDFHAGSALPWCSNRQLFTLIYQREVSSINSRHCRMLIVGKITLRLVKTKSDNSEDCIT